MRVVGSSRPATRTSTTWPASRHPQSPMRLHPRCHVIDVDGRFLLSRGRVRLELADPVDADRARRVLGWLTAPTPTLPSPADLGSFLGMVSELERAGLVVADDYTEAWVSAPAQRDGSPVDLAGRTVLVVASEASTEPLVPALKRLGAAVLRLNEPPVEAQLADVDLAIAYADGPDLRLLDETSAAVVRAGVAYLPAFHLGHEGLVGPYGVAGRTACFRCWELRWLGMAETTTAEVLLHAHLRQGGWRLETGWPSAPAAHLVELAVGMAARQLGSAAPRSEMSITDFATGRISGHHVEPHPACGRCAAPFQEPDRTAAPFPQRPPRDRRRAPLDDLDPIVDDRLGVAGMVEVEPAAAAPEPAHARLAVAHARYASAHPQQVWYDAERWTHGAAPTPDEARLVAVAEALERYCGTFTPTPAVLAAYDEVGQDALWPPDLPLFSARQYAQPGFPFDAFNPHDVHPWCWGFNLTRQRAQLVPQDAVRYGPAPSRLLHESSSGVAAHTSPEAALLGATLEVVERDALMIVWLNRISPPLVELDRHPDRFLAEAKEEIRQSGYQFRLADLTTDIGIPVMLAIATREDMAAPALILGAGAALEPTTAARKAMRELLGGIRGWQAVDWSAPELLRTDDVHELADHARAYYHPAWLSRAEFLWSTAARTVLRNGRPTQPTPHDAVASSVERLRTADLDLVAVDLTTPDVARHGMTVVRAVVPGAQPIGFGPTGTRLGGRRLYEAPAKMGYASSETTEASLNLDPHCYP